MTIRAITTKRIDITFGRNRTRRSPMGRHGGGWQWALGFHAGNWSRRYGLTIILYMLVTSIRIRIKGTER